MITVQSVLEILPDIAEGLASGKLTRWGSLIRVAAGFAEAGKVVAHLRDVASIVQQLTMPLASLCGLAGVGAAASVVNLGISASGFVLMNRKLKRLQLSMDVLGERQERLEQNLEDGFGRIGDTLVELRYLSLAQGELLKEALGEIRGFREELIADKLATIESWSLRMQRSPDRLDDAVHHFGQVRRSLGYVLSGRLPNIQQRQVWPVWLLRYRVWCMAGGLEVSALRLAGHDDFAAETANALAQSARSWAGHWSSLLMPEAAWGGAACIGHSAFEGRILPETILRIARLDSGIEMDKIAFLDWRRKGALRLAREMPSVGDQWVEQQASAAGLLDFMAESSERLQSLAAEMTWCRQQKLDYQNWEALGDGVDGMVLITQAA